MAENAVAKTLENGVDVMVEGSLSGANSVWNEGVSASSTIMSESMRFVEMAIPYLVTGVSALLIYIVGKFVAKMIRKLILKVLTKTGFDNIVAKSGANALKDAAGIRLSYSEILAQIVYYIIYISVIIAVLEKLGFTIVTDAMKDLIAYIPNILVALVILIIGTMVAKFIRELIERVSKTGGLSYAGTLGSIGYSLAMTFIFLIALGQLQIDISIITDNLTLIIATFCLIVAVAGAFATKGVATNIIATTYLKSSLDEGKVLEIGDISGKIVEITSTSVVVESDGKKTYIPSEQVFYNTYSVK